MSLCSILFHVLDPQMQQDHALDRRGRQQTILHFPAYVAPINDDLKNQEIKSQKKNPVSRLPELLRPAQQRL